MSWRRLSYVLSPQSHVFFEQFGGTSFYTCFKVEREIVLNMDKDFLNVINGIEVKFSIFQVLNEHEI
jgi:hypothetical protein